MIPQTQYGNILRIRPSGTSPLLLPANTHKQLIVIDFEYANANTPGLEFANHFTEWCYNYHDENTPWRCNATGYPTAEEQSRFIRAYVQHKPGFEVQTPRMLPTDMIDSETTSRPTSAAGEKRPGPTQSISNFMLDARAPPSTQATTPTTSYFSLGSSAGGPEQTDTSEIEEAQMRALLKQAREWRMANSALWIFWGIVQAKVPGMPLFGTEEAVEIVGGELEPRESADVKSHQTSVQTPINGDDVDGVDESDAEGGEEATEEEFDYLAYARDRAMFFWGDAVTLGFVKLEDLPADVRRDIKIVEC